jgi:hypothetical protein
MVTVYKRLTHSVSLTIAPEGLPMHAHLIYREVEPSAAELAAIEAEWPVIAAELEVTDAQCRLAARPGDVVAVRAHRRAVRQLLAVLSQPEAASREAARPVAVPVAAA